MQHDSWSDSGEALYALQVPAPYSPSSPWGTSSNSGLRQAEENQESHEMDCPLQLRDISA